MLESDDRPMTLSRQGYTIRQVSRFDAGRYACTADNGVGMPAKAFVSLQVLCKYDAGFRILRAFLRQYSIVLLSGFTLLFRAGVVLP